MMDEEENDSFLFYHSQAKSTKTNLDIKIEYND
mgnify:CR=1 FL=1